MLKRSNPLAHATIAVPVLDESAIDKQVDELIIQIRDTDSSMTGWLQKQAELTRLRLGDKTRKKKVPWRGASDISVPLTAGIIRRWKPGISSLILDAQPVASFTPMGADDIPSARLAEQFFDWLFLQNMKPVNEVVQLADIIAWRGHAYVVEGWEYKTARETRIVNVASLFPEGVGAAVQAQQQQGAQGNPAMNALDTVVTRLEEEYGMSRDDQRDGPALVTAAGRILDGAPFVKVTTRKVCTDRPSWKPIDPINVIVPPNQDPEDGEFFCILHTDLTQDDLRSMAGDGVLPEEQVNKLLATKGGTTQNDTGLGNAGLRKVIENIFDRKAGKGENSGEKKKPYILWQVFCRLDIDGDGQRERCILWYSPQLNETMALLEYPFPFDHWPVTYFGFAGERRPIDNQGIAEMVAPLQKITNAMHNARIDASQIILSPVMKRRITAGQGDVDYRPGAFIPVMNPNDIEPIIHDMRILAGLLQEEQVHQRLAETYVGVFDATLTNLQAGSERRTAAEVNVIAGLSSSIFGLDAKVFQTAFSRSLTKIWQLWLEFGPEETFFRVTGEEQPIRAKKSELAYNYDIAASGTPSNTNKMFQLNTLDRIMQNPFTILAAQQGLIEVSELYAIWMALLDYKVSKRVIRNPAQTQAAQTVIQAAQMSGGQQGLII